MYPYSVDELAWAIRRDREEEARQTRPHELDDTAPKSMIPRKPS